METIARRARKKLPPDPRMRKAIVDAAGAIVRDEGVGAVNVAYVLDKARISTRAFYRHFESKDDLVSAVFVEMARREARRLRRRMSAATTPSRAVVAWIDARLDLAFDATVRSDLRTVSLEAQSQMSAAPAVIGAAYEVILAPLVEHLERGVGCGEFSGIDPAAAALSIHGVIWSSTERQWTTGDCDRIRVREHVLGFCMRALGVPAQKGDW